MILVVAASLPLHAWAAQQLGGQPFSQWTVEDVYEPEPQDPADDFLWQLGFPLGDVRGDGQADFALLGTNQSIRTGNPVFHTVLRVKGGWQSDAALRMQLREPSPVAFTVIDGMPLVAFLNTPAGLGVVALDMRVATLALFDATSGQRLATIPYPAPPAGYPQFTTWFGVFSAGDVNRDGWDDLYFQGGVQSYVVSGLIDGNSGSVMWQDYVPNVLATGPMAHYGGDWPDLNGDSFPDYVSAACVNLSGSAAVRLKALSGVSGTLIWERFLSGNGTICQGTTCEDLNGDGVHDLVVADAGEAFALDGADGAILWSTPISIADPYLPSGASVSFFEGPVIVHPRPGQLGVRQARMRMEYFGHVGLLEEHAWLQLDASDGALLEVAFPPSDIQPWDDDPLEPSHSWSGQEFGLGDIDRDGLLEVARLVEDPDQDNPNINLTPLQFAILGQRTLLAPGQIPVGSSASFDAAIPSSSGRIALLSLSLGFDGAGGVSPAGWPTMLAADSLARTTLQNRPFLALLLPGGTGTWTVSVPNNGALVGRTLYSRVLVPDASGSGVYTHSTLGTSEIVP